MRSFVKWSLVSGLVSAFGLGAYRAYSESVVAQAQGEPNPSGLSFTAYAAVSAGLSAAVIAVATL